MLDAATLFALAISCTSHAPPAVVAVAAMTVSDGDVYRTTIDGKRDGVSNAEQAIGSASEAVADGRHVLIGLGQLSADELSAAGLTVADGYSPCKALAGLDVMLHDMASHVNEVPGRDRWLRAAALRAVGSDDAAIAGDFLERFEAIRSELPLDAKDSKSRGRPAASISEAATVQMPTSEPESESVRLQPQWAAQWDVFQSQGGSSLLIFSSKRGEE